jgi:hypothetical protein
VKLASQANAIQPGSIEAQSRRCRDSVLADTNRVAAGIRVLGFQRPGKHLDTLEKQLLNALSLLLNLTLQVLLVESVLKDQRAFLESPHHSRLELAE